MLQLQKDFPVRNISTVTWGAPVWDPFGTQKAEIGQENVSRFNTNGDLVSAFDNSALKTCHPDSFNYKPSFWHDFHNKGQAGGRLGGKVIGGVSVPEINNTIKTTWDTQHFSHFNKNLIYDRTEGDKMTE